MSLGREFAGPGWVRASRVRARAGAGQKVRAAGSGLLAGSTYYILEIFLQFLRMSFFTKIFDFCNQGLAYNLER